MQAKDVFLAHLMQGPKQFLIPIFQRTYSWREAQCYQLFEDVRRAGSSERIENHFAGSIVLIPNHQTLASIPQFLVIDGQQRLTTVTLLVAALVKRARELGIDIVNMTQIKAIEGYFLVNDYGPDDARYKLLLTKSDRVTLCALADGKPVPADPSRNVMDNFQLFCDLLADEETVKQIYAGFQKLKVVEVVLQQGQDDPQAIFESLNSTGVDLSQADLIRNYVLMRQDYEAQTRLYNDYWYPMEQLFGRENNSRFDRFIQDFLTLETCSNTLIKSRDVYPLFKEWFHKQLTSKGAEFALQRLLRLAGFYSNYMFRKEQEQDLLQAFTRLRGLVEVASPVVIRLYEAYSTSEEEPSTLTRSEFVDAIHILESYVLRRAVCAMQTRSLGSVFASLAQRIDAASPLESLKVALVRFKKSSRFPTDIEFQQALETREIYEMRICRYLLERLENDSKERIDTREFSIEHVMPQNEDLNITWQRMLGTNWKEVQQTWLHRLGNLTLTGYNPEYSDRDFGTKQSIQHGFKDSPLRLNRYIAEQEMWTEVQMAARGNALAQKALGIWKPLKVEEKTVAEYHLRDLEALSNNAQLGDVLDSEMHPLFNSLKDAVDKSGQDITLITTKRNLTFYTLSPFLQVMPRARYLALVIAVDHAELPPELADLVQDSSSWRFIRNADISGVYGEVCNIEDIHKVMPVIELAYTSALS